jgi:hypothetical protein
VDALCVGLVSDFPRRIHFVDGNFGNEFILENLSGALGPTSEGLTFKRTDWNVARKCSQCGNEEPEDRRAAGGLLCVDCT